MMTKYFKGWSSRRGRAIHLMATKWGSALCGSPIRFYQGDDAHLFKKNMEICDHCQREQRRKAKR